MQALFSKAQWILFMLGVLLIQWACSPVMKKTDALAQIQEPQVKELLQKVFTAMGGLEKWESIKSLHFNKKTDLYLASGAIEKSTDQQHDYYYQPKKAIQISWKQEGHSHLIQMRNGRVDKLIAGKKDPTANATSLTNSVLASTFVIGIPFKLLDEGTKLSYEGTKVLPNGKDVHVLKATYNPTEYSNHSKPDIWWHYFDRNTYQQTGYSVQLDDHTSYIENLSYDRVDGLLFTTKRKSWRMNDKGEKLYLRASYEYSEYATDMGLMKVM